MNTFIFVSVVVLLCVQTLHGTPVNGKKVVVTETKDGVTRTITNGGGSWSSNGQWIEGDATGDGWSFGDGSEDGLSFGPDNEAAWNIGDGKVGSYTSESSTTTNGGAAGDQAIAGSGSGYSSQAYAGSGGGYSAQAFPGSFDAYNGKDGKVIYSDKSADGYSGKVSSGSYSVKTSTGSASGQFGKGLSEENFPTGGKVGEVSSEENFPTGGKVGKGSSEENSPTSGKVGEGSSEENSPTGGKVGEGSSEENFPAGGKVDEGSSEENFPAGGKVDEGSSEENSPTGGKVGKGSSEENSSSSGEPCGCGHSDFNIDDLDLSGIDSAEISSHSTIIQQTRDKDCEKQLAKLNNDNDHLTDQLKSCNQALSKYTDEKSWVLGELETCRDEYECLLSDFTVLTKDIKISKKKYQLAYDEATKLKTLLIAAKSDSLACKTKEESLTIEYNKSIQINIENTKIINEYSTTIVNLRKEINEYKIQINNCGTESGEWKGKYVTEKENNEKLSSTIKNLEVTVANYKSKDEKTTSDLSSCENQNHEKDGKINELKDTISDLKSEKSDFENKFNDCDVSLNKCTFEFSEDEKDDLAVMALKDQLQIQLNTCNERADQLTKDYKSEKDRGNKCNDEFLVFRGECQNRYTQYDNQIDELNISYQGRLDKCEDDLTKEKKTVVDVNIEITNLRNELIESNNQLTISTQTSNEWQQKNEKCEKNSVTLQETIETLKTNDEKTREQLGTCLENSNSLQDELTASQGKLDECEEDLTAADKEVEDKDGVIDGLNSDILDLETSNAKCSGDLSELRCNVNKFLPRIEDFETKALKLIFDIEDGLKKAKDTRGLFVDGNNIECESCGTDGPCISYGAGGLAAAQMN